MTYEMENEPVVAESDKTATPVEAKQTINLVDLLKPQSNVKEDIKINARDLDSKELHFGNLEIVDSKVAKNLEDSTKAGTLANDWDGIKVSDSKVEPLNKTETMIMHDLLYAIIEGNVGNIQNMLSTLSENPQSVDRVLNALKAQLESENKNNQVNWEQGTDNNGHSFVRLNMFSRDNEPRSSGGTAITIGSDGRNSATHTDRWGSSAVPVSLETGLLGFLNK